MTSHHFGEVPHGATINVSGMHLFPRLRPATFLKNGGFQFFCEVFTASVQEPHKSGDALRG